MRIEGSRIVGTPNKTGRFIFTVIVNHTEGHYDYRNVSHSWVGARDQKTYQIEILDNLKHTLHLPIGQVGDPYFGAVLVNNSLPGERVRWTAEAVEGLNLSLEGDGSIQGKPIKPGTFEVSYEIFANQGHTLANGKGALQILPSRPKLAMGSVEFHGLVGKAIDYIIPYQGLREPGSITALDSLPEGLIVSNGKITGSVAKPGTFTIPVKAEDSLNASVTGTVNLYLHNKFPLLLDLPKEVNFPVQKPIWWSVHASGGEHEYVWELVGNLPESLVFENGIVKGKLPVKGEWPVTIMVKDRVTGEKASGPVTLRGFYPDESQPNLVTTIVPDAIVGRRFNYTMAAEGGIGKLRFDFEGLLPKGLVFTDKGIEGIPSEARATVIKVTVSDEVGHRDGPRNLDFNTEKFDDSKPEVLAHVLALAIPGQPYNHNFAAEGGFGHYTWKFTGELPLGLKFGARGIEGQVDANAQGQWRISAAVTDEAGQKSAPATFVLAVKKFDDTKPEVVTYGLPIAIPGQPYNHNFAAEGGFGHYTWKFTGELPPGLKFGARGIEGQVDANAQGQWRIAAAVTDEASQKSAPATFVLAVKKFDDTKPEVVTYGLPIAIPGQPYNHSFAAEGGFGHYTWKFTGELPPGLKFGARGIEGQVDANAQGQWRIAAAVTDEASQKSAPATFVLTTLKLAVDANSDRQRGRPPSRQP